MKKALDGWVAKLHTPAGREWTQRHVSYQQLVLNLVTDMSNIVAQYVAIAKKPTNRIAAEQGSAVHPRVYE
jgi:hypothetical protein